MCKLLWETNSETQIQCISNGASLPEHNKNLEKILKNISLSENNQLIKIWIEGWMCDFPHHEVTMDWMPTEVTKTTIKVPVGILQDNQYLSWDFWDFLLGGVKREKKTQWPKSEIFIHSLKIHDIITY